MAMRVQKVEITGRTLIDPETGEERTFMPRDEIDQLALDVVATLLTFGGMAALGVRRVRTGDVDGRPTHETTEFIVTYNTVAPEEPTAEVVDAEPVAAAS